MKLTELMAIPGYQSLSKDPRFIGLMQYLNANPKDFEDVGQWKGYFGAIRSIDATFSVTQRVEVTSKPATPYVSAPNPKN